MRVVLDTNVLVSGIAYPVSIPGRTLSAWQSGQLVVVLSRYILNEMVRVLPRLSRVKMNEAEMRDLADSLLFAAEIVEPATIPAHTLRDRADAPVLETFLAANADYLITGDKDLLAVADQYPIMTPAAFWARHGG